MVIWGYLMIAAHYGAFGYVFTADTPLRLLFEKIIYPLVQRFNKTVKEMMK